MVSYRFDWRRHFRPHACGERDEVTVKFWAYTQFQTPRVWGEVTEVPVELDWYPISDPTRVGRG